MIKIDRYYRIEKVAYGYRLVYEVQSEKNIKGEIKKVTSTKEWNYPNVKQCLKRYVNEVVNGCESIDEILFELNQLESIIDRLKI